MSNNHSSNQPTQFPLWRRIAIVACISMGTLFAVRAATSHATATPTIVPDVAPTRSEEKQSGSPFSGSTAKPSESQLVTKNIEDVQLGDRVVGQNPLEAETQPPSDIDPLVWRAVRLNMRQGGAHYDLAFLRPLSWIESTGAKVGHSIHMELHEMGLDGPAEVVSIDPCPEIAPDDGTGRMVVTGTMSHPAPNVLSIDITGQAEPLGVTTTHPIWSEDRQDFVLADDLRIGENLRTLTGEAASITAITPHRGPPEMVYNLEVDGEHVYCVGDNGLLVHNNCFDPSRIGHIFRAAAGHVNPSALAVQNTYVKLFEQVARNSANLRTDAVSTNLITQRAANAGVQVYTRLMQNGGQIWVAVRNGLIQNAGVNLPGAHR